MTKTTTDHAAEIIRLSDMVSALLAFHPEDTHRMNDALVKIDVHADALQRERDDLAFELEEAQSRTPEERGLMVCPFCDGKSQSPYDITPLSLEPPDVCGGCDGHRYINPSRLATHIVNNNEDLWGAFVAASLTEEEQEWV